MGLVLGLRYRAINLGFVAGTGVAAIILGAGLPELS